MPGDLSPNNPSSEMILPLGNFLRPKDSRGRESRTLFFVSITVVLLWIAIGLMLWKFGWSEAGMAVTDFATALATICAALFTVIGAWLGREWIADRRSEKERPNA